MLIVGSRVQESTPAAPIIYEDHVEIAVGARGLGKQTFHRISTVEGSLSRLRSKLGISPDYAYVGKSQNNPFNFLKKQQTTSSVKTVTSKSSKYEQAVVRLRSWRVPSQFNELGAELKNAGFNTKEMMFLS